MFSTLLFSVPEIRDMFTDVKNVTKFLNECAKRHSIVPESLGSFDSDITWILIFWSDMIQFLFFHKKLKYALDALEKIQKMTYTKAADPSRSLIEALTDPTFIVALSCAKKVMAVTKVLPCSLEEVYHDLYHVIQSVDCIPSTLQKWRGGESERDMD